MEANNLTPQNAEELKKTLEEQLKDNPDIDINFYIQAVFMKVHIGP